MIKSMIKIKIWDEPWPELRPKRFALFGGVPVAPCITSAQREMSIASAYQSNALAAANRHKDAARQGDGSSRLPRTGSRGVNVTPSRPSHLPWRPFDTRS